MGADSLPDVGDTTSTMISVLNGLMVLAAVCLLAYLALKLGTSRLRSGRTASSGRLQVLDRVDLGAGRSVLLLKVGAREVLVGVSEAGVFQLGWMDRRAGDEQDPESGRDEIGQSEM